ncbi:MAG: CRR6 family NdhI maturation factor [Cyanobacteria bacterium P01_A01_bin.45]
MVKIILNSDFINTLNLSPAKDVIEPILETDEKLKSSEQKLQFEMNYPLDTGDPRELSEVPEVRLWFIRLDTYYPWLPFLLNWQSGELGRYTAMLVPHQFTAKEGIQYNPEALEIFLMSKIFFLNEWLIQKNIPSTSRLQSMAQLLGYELDDALFQTLVRS